MSGLTKLGQHIVDTLNPVDIDEIDYIEDFEELDGEWYRSSEVEAERDNHDMQETFNDFNADERRQLHAKFR